MAPKMQPWGMRWRSSRSFILATVGLGLFTDLILYGIGIPVLPFLLQNRLQIPNEELQLYASGLLAIYSASCVLFSVPAGWIASVVGSRQIFLAGLAFLLVSTVIFSFARDFILLASSRVLQGASGAVVWTAGLDMVQDVVPRGDMGSAIGTIFAYVSVGELLGPVVGGLVYAWGGMEAIFGVSAGLLTLDLAMRLLVIDGKAAMRYDNGLDVENQDSESAVPSETDSLLPSGDREDSFRPGHQSSSSSTRSTRSTRSSRSSRSSCGGYDDRYQIPGEPQGIFKVLPLLYCFREPRLHMAMHLSFTQAFLIGALDATVPTEVASLFGFSSLQVGLIFIPLMLPYLALGSTFGQTVDRHGPRGVTTISYIYLIPCQLLLGLPGRHIIGDSYKVALFCFVLAINGVGLSAVSSSAFVEAMEVVDNYDIANPDLFGKNGPYAQLFGFNSVYFFAGLGVGPVVGGALRARFGYDAMGAAFAVISFLTAVFSFFVLAPRTRAPSSGPTPIEVSDLD